MVTDLQAKFLEESPSTLSEIVRRALDLYIEKTKPKSSLSGSKRKVGV